jgi:hypothetical protein
MSKDWEPDNPLADEQEARWQSDRAEQDEAEAVTPNSFDAELDKVLSRLKSISIRNAGLITSDIEWVKKEILTHHNAELKKLYVSPTQPNAIDAALLTYNNISNYLQRDSVNLKEEK